MGFRNIKEYVEADDAGQTWFTSFRKAVSSTATITSGYIDYTYFAGTPSANFYASNPLESAVVEDVRGIRIPSVAPATQHLKNLTMMTSAASATSTTNQRQDMMLCDYLLYYPFVDTDAVGELQEMINTVEIPRYEAGQVMAVAQSASSTIGQFTMTYTNQDGVSGRVCTNTFTQIVAGGGQLVSSGLSGSGFNPFIGLQSGDSAVKSIESVTFTAAGGGLMALVIVKPLLRHFLAQECRRTTSGNLESYGSASSIDSIIHKAGAPELKDGAILGLIAKGNAGSLASSILIGTLETVWN